jgi:hypothetical protein
LTKCGTVLFNDKEMNLENFGQVSTKLPFTLDVLSKKLYFLMFFDDLFMQYISPSDKAFSS